jgi:hypothetical protein
MLGARGGRGLESFADRAGFVWGVTRVVVPRAGNVVAQGLGCDLEEFNAISLALVLLKQQWGKGLNNSALKLCQIHIPIDLPVAYFIQRVSEGDELQIACCTVGNVAIHKSN